MREEEEKRGVGTGDGMEGFWKGGEGGGQQKKVTKLYLNWWEGGGEESNG